MKIQLSSHTKAAGYALLMVLTFSAISMILAGATLRRQSTVALLNDRNNQYVVNTAAAEAAVEKVIGRIIADFRNGGENQVFGNLASYRTGVPTSSESPYWTNFIFTDAKGFNSTNKTFVERTVFITNTMSVVGYNYQGLSGYLSTYRIISNVRQPKARFNVTACVQEDVQTALIPLFQFAIFYNGLLEFTTAATMTVRGSVHANGNIYVGSSSSLTFTTNITATGTISKFAPWAGSSSFGGAINYGTPPVTNWSNLSLPIGTNNSAAAVREVINIPPASESITSAMGTNRFYNKAQMIILVSNTTVRAMIKTPFGTPTNLNWSTLPPFITTNNGAFTDQRENKVVKTTQIDIGKYNAWARTNATTKGVLGLDGTNGRVPNVLFIADNRTGSGLYAIRLTNGTTLPTNNYGLTIATPNPLYVQGNYNAPTLGTNTGSMPASLLSDALTILSANWVDSASTSDFSTRPAVNTTVNAAIVTGVVNSTGSTKAQFSGGVHNLPRMLEDWSGDTLTLFTSIVNLFTSVRATNQFVYPGESGDYYTPPNRAFNFDQNFTNPSKQPPGTPLLTVVIRNDWLQPPPNVTNYAGY